jgi:hypothetical protein
MPLSDSCYEQIWGKRKRWRQRKPNTCPDDNDMDDMEMDMMMMNIMRMNAGRMICHCHTEKVRQLLEIVTMNSAYKMPMTVLYTKAMQQYVELRGYGSCCKMFILRPVEPYYHIRVATDNDRDIIVLKNSPTSRTEDVKQNEPTTLAVQIEAWWNPMTKTVKFNIKGA